MNILTILIIDVHGASHLPIACDLGKHITWVYVMSVYLQNFYDCNYFHVIKTVLEYT